MTDRDTVFVVTGNYDDNPHPHVLGVYDNEEAAEEHVAAIRQSIKPSEPVAYGYEETALKSDAEREARKVL